MFKNMTIKVKIITLLLISLLVLALVISSFSIMEIKSTLIKNNFDTLTAVRDSKTEQLNRFFEERIGDIKVLSRSDNVKNLINFRS